MFSLMNQALMTLTAHNQRHIAKYLRAWRKRVIRDREVFLGFQKSCADSGDRLGAKFFSEEAKHNLRIQRAIGFVLPYAGSPDKGQEAESLSRWPSEMESEFIYVAGRLTLKFF